jgi:hypothetical protein
MDAKEALREVIKRRITKTFRMALEQAEPLMYDESFETFRSKVLDCGNDQIRMIADDLEKFDIKWGFKREVFLPPGKE